MNKISEKFDGKFQDLNEKIDQKINRLKLNGLNKKRLDQKKLKAVSPDARSYPKKLKTVDPDTNHLSTEKI